jgi:hypothetical protein
MDRYLRHACETRQYPVRTMIGFLDDERSLVANALPGGTEKRKHKGR